MIIKTNNTDHEAGNACEPRPAMPRVKDMSPDDTPRERAEKYGCGVLSVPDLWALVLRTGTVGNPITELCRELMRANDGRITTLERRTRQELMAIKGLGPLKVIQIEAVLELIRRYNSESPAENPFIRTSADIYKVISPRIAHLPHEEVWAIILNQRNQVVKLYQASKGGWASSVFDVKPIIKEAMLENASAIALCHNHPSGSLRPSPQDDNITRICLQAATLMEIRFLDHLIVTRHGYYSYNDVGKLR